MHASLGAEVRWPWSTRFWIGLWACALAVWGGCFIASTSFVVEGERRFVLIDDAMITMAFARNLVEGHGLDWSRRGEPVEGFTHPLWLVLLVPVQFLPLDPHVKCLVVQVAGVVIWILILLAGARLLRRHRLVRDPVGLGAALVLSTASYALAHWTLFGMEAGLQALLLMLLVDSAMTIAADETPGRMAGLGLGAIAAALYWLRMDMAVPIALVFLWIAVVTRRRPHPRRALARAGALLAGAAVLLHGARWALFRELLPNTYFLKLAGIPLAMRLERGGRSLVEYLVESLLFWIAVLFAARRAGRDPRLGLLAAVIGGQLAYSFWVGGDVWDWLEHVGANRFVAPALPLAAILAGVAVGELGGGLIRRRATRWLPRTAAIAAALVVLCSANGLLWGERAPRLRSLAALQDPPGHAVSNQIIFAGLLDFGRVVRLQASVATVWAGIPAYFTDYRMIDALGYCDRHIARSSPHLGKPGLDGQRFTPGHAKWDYEYLVRELRPDAFFQTWGPAEAELEPFLRRQGYRRVGGYWLSSTSRNLTRWSRERLRSQLSRETSATP